MKKRVYRSMTEIERHFFPAIYQKRLERPQKPGDFGRQLGKELMEIANGELRNVIRRGQ